MDETGELPQAKPAVERKIVKRTNLNPNRFKSVVDPNEPVIGGPAKTEYIPQGPNSPKKPEETASFGTKAVLTVAGLATMAGVAKGIDEMHSADAAEPPAPVVSVQQDEQNQPVQEVMPAEMAKELVASEVKSDEPGLFDEIFHDLSPFQKAEAQAEVAKFKERILAKEDYEKEHIEIPMQYKDVIENTANAYGISVDTLMGLIGTENGGGPDKINSISKARGVAQFMPDTAVQYKLIDKYGDRRGEPVLSIDAAGRYLRDTKALFAGDEGMALWSYHAGPGNVYHALRIYFYDVNHENLHDYGAAIQNNNADDRIKIEERTKELILQDKLDISKLLANEKVKEFTATLKDYSETYPATVVAMSQVIREYQKQHPVHDLGNGLRVFVGDNPTAKPTGR